MSRMAFGRAALIDGRVLREIEAVSILNSVRVGGEVAAYMSFEYALGSDNVLVRRTSNV